ncbi:MAG TPA: ribose 5-phosphate isomerase B [Gemmatimonadales bacterium]|jgi:ribose 5-phosphate isomerase B|nr:ribose 5-phosphate isomerase B [Gemmatimonadales bacterium]
MSERIPIGSDHAGFAMKTLVAQELRGLGFDVADVGSHSADPADYADYAHVVAREVEQGQVQRGVLLCGSGLGMSYAANRHSGVRAAVVWSPEIAVQSRQHNDANVLVLPARYVDPDTARAILRAWLETPFEGGRHLTRIRKIEETGA